MHLFLDRDAAFCEEETLLHLLLHVFKPLLRVGLIALC
jgi:hypothetical protein